MKCPECGEKAVCLEVRTLVIGIRRRRYVCDNKHRFSTHEQYAQKDLRTTDEKLPVRQTK